MLYNHSDTYLQDNIYTLSHQSCRCSVVWESWAPTVWITSGGPQSIAPIPLWPLSDSIIQYFSRSLKCNRQRLRLRSKLKNNLPTLWSLLPHLSRKLQSSKQTTVFVGFQMWLIWNDWSSNIVKMINVWTLCEQQGGLVCLRLTPKRWWYRHATYYRDYVVLLLKVSAPAQEI